MNVSTGQSESEGTNGTGVIGRSQSFSTREDVEKEIKQCGVSVKNLKANYEIQNQQSADNNANRVYKRKRSLPVVNPILNNDQLTRSLEVQTDISYVQECIEMRKERIVFLFLEHWRKYTISESFRTKMTAVKGNKLDVGWEDYNDFSAQITGRCRAKMTSSSFS
ncbi:hypothetical protein F7725_000506 [Dissostichus mawsoni]|uniref:Uncharacterized protein n=1 Tax=Dissostichus mawsoni TaxID=36200 RepID=A0A7J5ZGJ4_DISMA|nr:hypothetical protein F7725_000506 [Dissostichus mawsoni]